LGERQLCKLDVTGSIPVGSITYHLGGHMPARAHAQQGKVVVLGQEMSREEAANLLVEIASAIQHSGDISDPHAVWLHENVRDAVDQFNKTPQ
jgi:hypothetical protein